jgi:phage baseplate assembly protein W
MSAVDRERLFGDDLRLYEVSGSFDLRRRGGGDLELAHGIDAISQALQLRLSVRRGELAALGWPDYGSRLHELIGEPSIARTHARLMALAREAVEADPRVVAVDEIRAYVPFGDRDVVRLEMEVQLITERNPLNLVHDVRLEGS